jgi:mannose-1-phosphate guanylyltransferase
MVLSAGLGTRLRPLTDRVAKPLVPVGDRPALAQVLDRLQAAGVERAVVNAHHHADQVAAFVRARGGAGGGLDVRLSEERELLGTAGGIARAGAALGEGDALVWNGDILADFDVRALVASHAVARAGAREGAPSAIVAATLVVQPMDAARAGPAPVGLDAAGRVVRLRDHRFAAEARGAQYLGIALLSAALRDRLPRAGGLIEDALVPALARGEIVSAMPFDGAWHDIGTLESYRAANLAWLDARGLRAWAAPGARIAAGVVLDRSILGEGAVVEGEGTLTECVVWPGARAVAPQSCVVVTPSCAVVTSSCAAVTS